MKKIMMVLNQVQAGMGSDENSELEPLAKKGAIGPGVTLEPMFNNYGATVAMTFICGDTYFSHNEESVTKKMVGIARKLGIDAVLCGPAFHYPNAGEMAALAAKNCTKYGLPAIAVMSVENAATETYKEQVNILKMPRKGDIGLSGSFTKMAYYTAELAKENTIENNTDDFF